MASFFHLPCQPASHFSSLLSITLSPFPFLTLSKNAFHAQSFNLTIFQVPVVFSLSPTSYTLPTSLSASAPLHSSSLFFCVLSFLFSFFASGCAALGSSLSPSCSCVDRVQLSVMCYCCAVCEYVCIVQAVMLCQLPTFMLCCSFPLSSHLPLLRLFPLPTDLSTAALPSLTDSTASNSIFIQLLSALFSALSNNPHLFKKKLRFMQFDMCSQEDGYLCLNVCRFSDADLS